jgi:hypothetical protein
MTAAGAADTQPEVSVKRKWYRGDHYLRILDITVRRSA